MNEFNQGLQSNAGKVIKISKRKTLITIIVLVVIFLVAWWVKSNIFDRTVGMQYGISAGGISATNLPSIGGSESQMPDYWREDQPSINDTREFLKVNYSATIKTRNVEDVVDDVKDIIKDFDGRVDSSSSSEKYGRITFVVAKSELSDFKDEIEQVVHKKLYTDDESSQNLLSQKQSIEERTETIINTLASLNNQKASLLTKHTQTVSSIQRELARVKADLLAVRTVISNTTDPMVLASLRAQESSLVQQETLQTQRLNSENSTYATQNQNLENQIANQDANLSNVTKQDEQFTDNIETVNGTIYVNWVNLWQIAEIFSPIHPSIIILALIILAWIYLRRKNYIPRIEFE